MSQGRLISPPRWRHPCPMCAGSGQRASAILARTIACPWCGGRGHVRLERARALRAQLRTKAEREQEQEQAA